MFGEEEEAEEQETIYLLKTYVYLDNELQHISSHVRTYVCRSWSIVRDSKHIWDTQRTQIYVIIVEKQQKNIFHCIIIQGMGLGWNGMVVLCWLD